MIEEEGWLAIRKEQAVAYGKQVPGGFLVRAGSTAMREGSPTVKRNRGERDQLVVSGVLVPDDNPALFRFAVDHVFTSISAAAGIVIDGNSNGGHWKEGKASSDFVSLQALLGRLTREEIDAAMRDYETVGLSSFLTRGGFVRPQVWIKGQTGDQSFPAKATVAAALGHLPNGRALSAKEFFNGFGETQAFARLEELGYELLRKGEAPDPHNLSREKIEAAIDAYDRYRATGENREFFAEFGSPAQYWVRSTRERESQAYPTKPIFGFATGTRAHDVHGGWNRPTGPVTLLYNAGFIIVDQDNRPLPPPDQRNYLIREADRIRLCALNYFIEPARERDAVTVSIRVGDLAAAMGLEDVSPNICQALGGEKFQQLAQVLAPTHTTPNPSSSTIFTYKLQGQAEAATVVNETETLKASVTNLILYGPPGTGKTYHTAWEAVQLCLGEAAAALQGDDKRDDLMAEYRRLVAEGRVEFVTFHQSMSYEEFVEGLRPSTGEDDDPELSGNSTGFRLEPHDGVFKRISERARLDRGSEGPSGRLDRSARVFKVALGRRQAEEDRIRFGLDHGLIHVGWGGDIDWSDERFDEFSEILTEWRARKEPDANGHNGNVVITWSFRSDMQVGDYVVISDGRDRIQAFGQVTGEYFYDPDTTFHPHRRKVEWLWRDSAGIERERFYSKPFRRHSVYKLDQSLVDWEALDVLIPGAEAPSACKDARDHVLIIDEINRANISKVFGELITLLEPDKRLGMQNEIRLVLPYSKKSFGVPANLHIIGTMNTADRSIALLDTALRRRFIFRELMPDPSVLSVNVDGIDLQKLLATINERIEYLFDREHQIGHAYFTSCKSRADVEEVMRHKVIPLLAEYFYEDWSKVAAVLGDRVMGPARFLEARQLAAPPGISEDDLGGEKLRWRVKDQFEFSEFEA